MGAVEKSEFERAMLRLKERGFDTQNDDGEITGLACPDCGRETLTVDFENKEIRCSAHDCERLKVPGEVAMAAGRVLRGPAQAMSEAQKADSQAETERARSGPEPNVGAHATGARPDMPAPQSDRHNSVSSDAQRVEAAPRSQAAAMESSSHLGEKIIIALLSLVFLAVGLLAAAMSGFANFLAFGSMVQDPLQSRVWAWTGIIACVCSFAGFTFAYWHGANRRFGEAARAGLIALAGAATSLVGTQMYMEDQFDGRLEIAAAAGARADLLDMQIEDWRGQLDALPSDIRSVEGLEAYISEVERVGRTDERPYRLALDELGQARRRADLEGRIETARAELANLKVASLSEGDDGPADTTRTWFFASMLEVFSSQGTSIGFVALMILAVRRRPSHHGD